LTWAEGQKLPKTVYANKGYSLCYTYTSHFLQKLLNVRFTLIVYFLYNSWKIILFNKCMHKKNNLKYWNTLVSLKTTTVINKLSGVNISPVRFYMH